MNRESLLALFLGIILVFTSCTAHAPNNSTNPKDYIKGNCSKNGVADFMRILESYDLESLSSGFALDKKHCCNITPECITQEISAQIFKFSDSFATFLYLDGEVYSLSE